MKNMLPFAATGIAAVFTFVASGVHGASSAGIAWKACSPNRYIECGTYQVPLDYAKTSVGYATLAVARYKAYRSPRLGTLFVNPGGPGGSGTDMIQNGFGEQMSDDTNGQYDIVGWDPRGVNMTTPAISCGFTNQDQLSAFLGTTMLATGVQARGNFTDKRDIDYFYSQLAQTDSQIAALGQRCAQYDGGVLKYIGSAAAARDIISMSDALEGPGKKINYWGISYGTIIGNYLVNMFPDRVGRVIIDGVVDATAYATQPSYKMWTLNTASIEATFSGFMQTCAAAGPGGCAIAQKGSTPDSIAQWVWNLINLAYDANLPNIASSFIIRNRIMSQLYTPQQWVQLAKDLAGMYNDLKQATAGHSMTRRSKRAADSYPSVLTNGQNLVPELIATVAITCVDSIDQGSVTTKEMFDEMLRVTHEETPMFGVLMSTVPGFYCHHFPVRAVERYTGPFNHMLAYPILVIGNEADPITPFASAKSVSDLLGNSAYLVEQDDYGHSSLAERSDCTRSVVSDYLLQGKLPEKSKFCGTNQVIFPGPGVTKGSVANAVSNLASTTGTDNDVEQSKSQRTTLTLFILSIVFGVLSILLAISLVVVITRNKKNKRYAAPSIAAASTTHAFSDGRGSMEGFHQPYSEPWEGKKAVY